MGKSSEYKRHTYTPNDFYDYLATIEAGMSGDIAIKLTPAALGSESADIAEAIGEAEKFTREVVVELVDSAGNVHEWFDGELAVSVADTSTSGTAAIAEEATAVTLVKGKGSVVVEYTGTWVADETCTVTVGTNDAVMGYTLTAKTSVDTVVTTPAE